MTMKEPQRPEGKLHAARVPPGESRIHPPETETEAETGTEAVPVNMGLIVPVASDEALVESFKRYQALKEKLLDESDYTWFCVYKVTDKVKRKGSPKRTEAEADITAFRARGMTADLEKKMKKSGVYKLSKAFGISTVVIEKDLNRDKGYAFYLVRATAPNGQSRERSGSCDRSEAGRHEGAFDHVDAIALTRAEDRAIMALLGGENTAEEFIEEPLVVPDGPPPAQGPSPAAGAPQEDPHRMNLLANLVIAAKAAGLTDEQLDAKTMEAAGKPWRDMAEEDIIAATEALKAKVQKDVQAPTDASSQKPSGTALSDLADKQTLLEKMFTAIEKAGISLEEIKHEVKWTYGVESSKDMTAEQILAVTRFAEKREADDAETARKSAEAAKSPPPPLPPDAQASIDAIDQKFSGAKPAKPVDKQTLLGRMFAAIEKAGLDPQNVKREVKRTYGIESSKDMTIEQILEVTSFIEAKGGEQV